MQEALLWVDEVGQKEKDKVLESKQGQYMRRHSMRQRDQCAALVVGHYCHDRLTLQGGQVVHGLGGSVSYITNVFGALGMECKVHCKVASSICFVLQFRNCSAPSLVYGWEMI